MRIFFIVAAAVLFADFVAAGLRRLNKAYEREARKATGMSEDEYEEEYYKKHPKSIRPLVPFFWVIVIVIGFLWAIFWH